MITHEKEIESMSQKKLIAVITLTLLLGLWTISGATYAFTPKQGQLYEKEINGVKFHVYTSPIPAGASASVVIETEKSLILQDTQQHKPQNDELKALIASLGKPLHRIYVSHDHSHHWAGLEMFEGVPVYANQATIDAIKQKGEEEIQGLKKKFGVEAIPYTKAVVPTHVVEAGSEEKIDGVLFVFTSPAPQLTGPVLFIEFPNQNVLIQHHLAYVGVHVPMPPVEARLAKLNEMKSKNHAWVIGGHGMPVPGTEYFSKTIDYFTMLGKVLKESPDAAAAKEKMTIAYPSYGGVFLLDMMLPEFYKK
jgi:glyoxylase-like metal-dependent hydrolase (beta-lactamase superfamily II)